MDEQGREQEEQTGCHRSAYNRLERKAGRGEVAGQRCLGLGADQEQQHRAIGRDEIEQQERQGTLPTRADPDQEEDEH